MHCREATYSELTTARRKGLIPRVSQQTTVRKNVNECMRYARLSHVIQIIGYGSTIPEFSIARAVWTLRGRYHIPVNLVSDMCWIDATA